MEDEEQADTTVSSNNDAATVGEPTSVPDVMNAEEKEAHANNYANTAASAMVEDLPSDFDPDSSDDDDDDDDDDNYDDDEQESDVQRQDLQEEDGIPPDDTGIENRHHPFAEANVIPRAPEEHNIAAVEQAPQVMADARVIPLDPSSVLPFSIETSTHQRRNSNTGLVAVITIVCCAALVVIPTVYLLPRPPPDHTPIQPVDFHANDTNSSAPPANDDPVSSPADRILAVLNKHTLNRNHVIRDDINSTAPEDRAAHVLLHIDPKVMMSLGDDTSTALEDWIILQRYVVACLFVMHYSKLEIPKAFLKFHECISPWFWQCNEDNRITDLILGRDHLLNEEYQGYLLPDLGLLRDTLETMDFSHNSMKGSIPSSFAALTQLRVLQLQGNHLTGTIPSELLSLTSLDIVSLQDNPYLTGTLEPLCSSVANDTLIVADCNRVDCPCCTYCCPEAWEGIPSYNSTTTGCHRNESL